MLNAYAISFVLTRLSLHFFPFQPLPYYANLGDQNAEIYFLDFYGYSLNCPQINHRISFIYCYEQASCRKMTRPKHLD